EDTLHPRATGRRRRAVVHGEERLRAEVRGRLVRLDVGVGHHGCDRGDRGQRRARGGGRRGRHRRAGPARADGGDGDLGLPGGRVAGVVRGAVGSASAVASWLVPKLVPGLLDDTYVSASTTATGTPVGQTSGGPPTHVPPEQVSLVVQALPSSHGTVLGACTQPVAGSHESVV